MALAMTSQPKAIPNTTFDLFISYAAADDRIVKRAVKALEREGLSILTAHDVRETAWGQDLTAWLDDVRQRVLAVVFFVSENFTQSEWCLTELAALRRSHDTEQRPHLLPVKLDNTPMPAPLVDVFSFDLREADVEKFADAARSKVDDLRSSGIETTTLPMSELTERLASGDADAFVAFYERMAPRAFAIAYKLTQDQATATDIVQEAFLRFYTRASSIAPSASLVTSPSPETILYTLVINTGRDYLRQTENASRSKLKENRSAKATIVRRLKTLDKEDQAIVTLHAVKGLPLFDVAKHLGISEALATAKYHRSVRWLRHTSISERDG